jgi:hypothetical protein
LQKACSRAAVKNKTLELQYRRVAEHLLQPLHEPAVREALGCLIPLELDPKLDGKRPKAKAGQAVTAPKLYLHAGSWRVNMLEEEGLLNNQALTKGVIEFFLLTLGALSAPGTLYVASHSLGHVLQQANCNFKAGIKEWHRVQQGVNGSCEVLLPVLVEYGQNPRKGAPDMMLLVLRSKDAGSLGHPLSRQFMVSVYDDTRRNTQARKIAERFIEQVLEKKRFSIEDVHVQGFPFEQPRTDRKDVAPMALCLVAEMVAGSRGVDVQSDVLHRPFSILPRQLRLLRGSAALLSELAQKTCCPCWKANKLALLISAVGCTRRQMSMVPLHQLRHR